MFEPAVFYIRVEGEVSESWCDYFGAQSMSVEVDEDGLGSTILISEPVDQAALVGMINHLNGLGHALISVQCVSTPVEKGKGMATQDQERPQDTPTHHL
jgi:hypothetical protein